MTKKELAQKAAALQAQTRAAEAHMRPPNQEISKSVAL